MKYSDFMRGCKEVYPSNCTNTARHEVGHAIVTLAMGYLPIKEVQVWRSSGRIWNGTVQFDTSCLNQRRAQDEAAFYRKAVMVSLAGTLAVVPTLRGEELADALSFLDAAVFAMAMGKIADESTEDAVLEELTIKATNILEEHHDALGQLTRLLVRRRRLDAQDVEDIVKKGSVRPSKNKTTPRHYGWCCGGPEQLVVATGNTTETNM
jgi:hypothetical protein